MFTPVSGGPRSRDVSPPCHGSLVLACTVPRDSACFEPIALMCGSEIFLPTPFPRYLRFLAISSRFCPHDVWDVRLCPVSLLFLDPDYCRFLLSLSSYLFPSKHFFSPPFVILSHPFFLILFITTWSTHFMTVLLVIPGPCCALIDHHP